MIMEGLFSVEGGNNYSLTNDDLQILVYKFQLNFKEGKTGALGSEYVFVLSHKQHCRKFVRFYAGKQHPVS